MLSDAYLHRWQTRDGCQVRLGYIMTRTGGCIGGVDDLLIGWPLGAPEEQGARIYTRDPNTTSARTWDGDSKTRSSSVRVSADSRRSRSVGSI